MTSEPRRIDITLPELRVAALTWGPQDGPLAILVHGYPDSAWSWRHLGPALADRDFRVVAPFSRGYAPSDIPDDGDYHVGALMHDVIGVHRELGGNEQAVLVGHDWGAVTANGIAAWPRSPFRRVVSMAVPPVPAMTRSVASPAETVRMLARQARMSWYMAFNQVPRVAESSLDRLIPRLWRDWSPGHDPSGDLPHVFDSLPDAAHRRAALGYYRAQVRPRRPAARYRELQDFWLKGPVVPMLYLHGADDGCMQVGYTRGVRDVLPEGSAVEIVPDAGHFLQVERPEEVNRLVLDFLGSP
ncbi:alpha/beta fold hydrolase [Williamsia serinedens]|uniref:Pimeloyl-ACP methyl ester carboxylesterase n=1 Tax=Williamsia serinedens TaxID=391736 RepID=A0ABT1GWC4_9NOCA|nr:alpha/beta hydrolase [Williamsia serinedens]MCP2158862.1 Pimeloyl-ACP methyl ester carboxylesterase [Williamsia serinedens]